MNDLEISYQKCFDLVVYLREKINIEDIVIYPLSWNTGKFFVGFRNAQTLPTETLYNILNEYTLEGWKIDESAKELLNKEYCDREEQIAFNKE